MEPAKDDVSSGCGAIHMLSITIHEIASSNKKLVDTNVDLETEKQLLNDKVRELEVEKQLLNDKVRERDTDIRKLCDNNRMLANKLNASQLACVKLDAKVNYFENEKSQQTERNRKLEAANERLQIEADELKTANERLQIEADELKTANDELKTANDELKTANDELGTANEDLKAANGELLDAANGELPQVYWAY